MRSAASIVLPIALLDISLWPGAWRTRAIRLAPRLNPDGAGDNEIIVDRRARRFKTNSANALQGDGLLRDRGNGQGRNSSNYDAKLGLSIANSHGSTSLFLISCEAEVPFSDRQTRSLYDNTPLSLRQLFALHNELLRRTIVVGDARQGPPRRPRGHSLLDARRRRGP